MSKITWYVIFYVRFASKYGIFLIEREYIILNRLSWDDKEINKETIALYPVEKDRMETKLWRFDLMVHVKNSQRRDFLSTFCIKIWQFLFIVREYFLTNTYLEKIHKQTKNLLQFTPWRKTKWKLVYEENWSC